MKSTLKQRLDELAKAHGVTAAAIADAAGVTPQAVVHWAKRGSLGRESAQRVAARFGCSIDWLLTGAEPAKALESVQARPTIRLDLLSRAIAETDDAFAILGVSPTTEQRAEAAAQRYEALLAESITTSAPLAAAS